METSLFQTFGPYQTAAQNKTLCHVSESEIQDSPGDHFGTSHGFFYAIIFKTPSKEIIQLPFMKVQKHAYSYKTESVYNLGKAHM